ARRARAAGIRAALVCRRYHPGPQGRGDEELLFRAGLGDEAVFAGTDKQALAAAAAAAGHPLVIVDRGFSHLPLARDLDVGLIDAGDPWGGGQLLPAGRLREPLRALPRAGLLVLSRVPPGTDPAPLLAEISRAAPAARRAAGRHRVTGVR